jgi:chromosome segregation ATPase
VSQPDLASGLWLTGDPLCPKPESIVETNCSNRSADQKPDQDLLDQLAQSHVLEQQRIARIYHLEQALDQALACLSDLRMKLQDQQILEAQLATTEEFAYVQQQAIVHLKQQLTYQRQILEARISEAQGQHQTAQILSTTEAMTQAQHAELERLQARIAQDWTKIQTHRSSLEQQIGNLKSSLRRTKTLASEQEIAITSLKQDLAIAQIKVEELETQLAKQVRLQARWQQNCYEAEGLRDRYQTRVAELEQQVSEMQEQIFAQARQSGEYEAAVQHWKDRYLDSHRQIAQLKELLDQTLSQAMGDSDTNAMLDPALLKLLLAIQSRMSSEETSPNFPSLSTSRFSTLDLPDFLVRHRSYRPR